MRNNTTSGMVGVYADLIKYKLSLAVTFSSVTGYFIYLKTPDLNLIYLIAGVFFLASGSSVMNQYSEISYDALMKRTMDRPLPGKRINRKTALLAAGFLFCPGILFLAITGLIPLLLGVFNILLYNVAYTRLKRITPLSIVPGALVGAIPPLIGFEAAGGGFPGFNILIFSSFMFFWQLPHFMLILLKYHKEYETAGFLTVSYYMNGNQIRILIFFWVLISTSMLIAISAAGIVFSRYLASVLIPLNIVFILAFYYLLFRKQAPEENRGAFILINSFSLLIMVLFMLNSFIS